MKPKLILSIPNAGSDWFASCVALATGWKYWDKEFFNPACNLPLTDKLIDARFGCELVSCFREVWHRPDMKLVHDLMNEFRATGCHLNKEVWCFGKIAYFAQHFDCIALVRHAETLFPPSRLRVLQWYEAIGTSDSLNTQGGFLDRVFKGWHAAYTETYRVCQVLKIPVLDYDELGNNMAMELPKIGSWLGGDQVMEKLVQTMLFTWRAKNVQVKHPVTFEEYPARLVIKH